MVTFLRFLGNRFVEFGEQYGLETEVAKHLADNYGDRAWAVASMAESPGRRWPLHGVRLNSNYPCTVSSCKYFIFIVNRKI